MRWIAAPSYSSSSAPTRIECAPTELPPTASARFRAASRSSRAKGGRDALESLYGVGKSIAAAIEPLNAHRTLGDTRSAAGEVTAEQLLLTIPALGETLARAFTPSSASKHSRSSSS